MHAASWQRWADACRGATSEARDAPTARTMATTWWAPSAPWEPVGDAAQLAGWSLLIVAFASVLQSWALTGRRAGRRVRRGADRCGAGTGGVVGVASLRWGLAGSVVHPIFTQPCLCGFWCTRSCWFRSRMPLVAGRWSGRWAGPRHSAGGRPCYAVGSYHAQPWWEAISGLLTGTAGLCLVGAAASCPCERSRSHICRAPGPATSRLPARSASSSAISAASRTARARRPCVGVRGDRGRLIFAIFMALNRSGKNSSVSPTSVSCDHHRSRGRSSKTMRQFPGAQRRRDRSSSR